MFAVFNASTQSPERVLNVSLGCQQHPTAAAAAAATARPPTPPPPASACASPWYTLVPTVNALAQQRLDMQSNISTGWGLWHQMSFVKHVLLPEGQVVTLYLCDLQSKTCTEKVRTGAQRGSPQFRLAEHAVDRSYGRMSLAQGSCNVTIEFGGGDDLLVLITPAPASTKADEMPNGRPHPPAGCSQHAIVITGSEAWFRSSAIATPQPNQLTFDSVGLRSTTVHTTAPSNASFEASLPATVTSLPHIAVGLGGTTGEGGDEAGASGRSVGSSSSGSFGLSTAGAHTIAEVTTLIAAAREAELARYARFGDLAETKKVVQAAVMWTSVYNPIESGPFANVIRGNPFYLDNNAVNEDWDYVIFDWFVNSTHVLKAMRALGTVATVLCVYRVLKSMRSLGTVATVPCVYRCLPMQTLRPHVAHIPTNNSHIAMPHRTHHFHSPLPTKGITPSQASCFRLIRPVTPRARPSLEPAPTQMSSRGGSLLSPLDADVRCVLT